jgi:uncharacterized phiE125 gp8 family phage protein
MLLVYLQAAVDLVEAKTQRALISRTFRLDLECFPDNRSIKIPVAPLVSVATLQYYTTGGVLTTLASSNYYVDLTAILGEIQLVSGAVFPPTQLSRPNAVQVSFTAGYGASYDLVPAGLRFIVMSLAGHFYLNRAPIVVGGGAAMEVPRTLSYALDAYKIWSV